MKKVLKSMIEQEKKFREIANKETCPIEKMRIMTIVKGITDLIWHFKNLAY